MNITKIPIIQITKGTSIIEINPQSDVGVASGTLKLDKIIVNNELKFGELYSDKFEVEIYNIEDDLSGCPIQLFIEEDNVRTVKFTGVVESSKRDRIGHSRKIIAYDWVHYHRDDDISSWWNSFWVSSRTSATIKSIRDSLMTYMGFTADSNTYVNDNIVIPNNFNLYTDLKFHTIISMLCELQGTLPHIAEDGSFKFITINNTTEDITGDYEGNNCTWEDYTTNAITGVGIYSTSDDLSQLIGTNANVYKIAGNLFALNLNASGLTTLGTNLLSAISSIQFVPNTIKMKITNFDLALGQRYNTEHGYGYVMSNAISGVCMVEQTLKSVAMGENLSEYVDTRNDTMIEGSKMSKFQQDIDGFTLEVQRIDRVATQASEDAETAIETAESFEDDIQTANTNAQLALNRANGAITTDTLHYLATPLSSGVTTETAGWTTTPQSMTPTNKYLWTYHTYTYADAHTSDTTPVITGVYGEDGQQGQTGPAGPTGPTGADGLSITEVTSIYYASGSSTPPSAPSSEVTTTSTSVYNTWTKGVPALTSTYTKLYTCDQVKYSDNTFTWTTPVLNNAITVSFSEIKQLANQIVLKVQTDGTVAQVKLGADASTGGKVVIKGDNIELDGNVTVTDGFVLKAGVIQSANYVANTRGMKITLSNGALDSKNFKISNTGNVTATNLYATNLIFNDSILYNVGGGNKYFIKYTNYDDAGWYEIYNIDDERAISLGGYFQGSHGPKNILRGQWWAEKLSIGGVADYTTTDGSRPGVIISKDNEGGQVSILGTSIRWLIDSYDNASLRFLHSNGKWIRFANDGTIWYSNNTRRCVGSYTNTSFTTVTDILKITSSNYAVLATGSGNFSFSIASWSDSALKKNIKDSQVNALDIINTIKMREFDFKEKEYGTHEDIGYVADELVKIIPEAVVEVPISDEDKEKYGKDYLYQVNDGAIVKYLVKAVQELSKEVKRLKNGGKEDEEL